MIKYIKFKIHNKDYSKKGLYLLASSIISSSDLGCLSDK